jgi:CRP-like cAMP-binding protein
MSYTAACNRHHTIYQQLCRWLLRHIELTRGHEFVMTQEAIANGMGVRRESVTEAAGQLRSLHAISWQRGRIVVLDRDALERGTCECHAAVSREYRRLLPPQTAA